MVHWRVSGEVGMSFITMGELPFCLSLPVQGIMVLGYPAPIPKGYWAFLVLQDGLSGDLGGCCKTGIGVHCCPIQSEK